MNYIKEENFINASLYLLHVRDENTEWHVRRSSTYVSIIGSQLLKDGSYKKEISSEYIQLICQAALLHDIGKIDIPDSILKKTGKYNQEDYVIMKNHTIIGANFIKVLGSSSPLMDEACNMAEFHHEKWNGNGYPHGISGTKIPLSARIMSVADVFDACSSKRCYKDAFSFNETLKIIIEGKGEAFDPIVVEAFLNAEAEIKKALHSFQN